MMDINYTPGVNVGGLYAIRYTPVVGLKPTPASGRPIIITDDLFLTGNRWYDVYITPFTASFEEKQEPTDNGSVWNAAVSSFLPSPVSAQMLQHLEQMTRHRFILQITDLSGESRQVGTPTHPLQFSYRHSTGQQVGDRRGYTLSWSGPLVSPSPFI